jgi:uncharacterized protein (DUF2252 family)
LTKISLFTRNPINDLPESWKNYVDEKRGEFFYFRHLSLAMQQRFMELFDHNKVPKVFLHGNPHVENYVITAKGAAMVDFDRSRVGPYAWDVVRFLCSLALKNVDESIEFISKSVEEYFLEGYLRSFYSPNVPYRGASLTAEHAEYAVWYPNTNEFLDSNKKWVKKMRKNPLSPEGKRLRKLVKGYLKSRKEEDLLKNYTIEEAGRARGSFGNQRFLIVLKPLQKDQDRIFLDIKTVYQDADNQWYSNPFKHHGLRMLKASKLYAPGVEFRLGFTTLQNQQYWGREIPHKSGKIKAKLSEVAQLDIAYSVGTQLGRAHRKSLEKTAKPKELSKHLEANYQAYLQIGAQMNEEVKIAHQTYVEEVKPLLFSLAKVSQ